MLQHVMLFVVAPSVFELTLQKNCRNPARQCNCHNADAHLVAVTVVVDIISLGTTQYNTKSCYAAGVCSCRLFQQDCC